MKKLSALTLSTAIYLSLVPSVFAKSQPISISPCTKGGGADLSVLCKIGAGGISDIISAVITLFFVVAILLALGFLIFGGIKWITSGGDKGKVEAARGTIVAALVGLVLVFLSYFILNLLSTFFGIGSLTNGLSIPSLGF